MNAEMFHGEHSDQTTPGGLTYEELEKGITSAPLTYLPALLIAVVETCQKKDVFVPGGLELFVKKVVSKTTPGDG